MYVDLNLPLYIDKSIISELNKKSSYIVKNEIIEVISYSLLDKIELFSVNLIFENILDSKIVDIIFRHLKNEIDNDNRDNDVNIHLNCKENTMIL